MKNIAVIGGGIIGLATAYKLGLKGAKVSLFEKEQSFGLHQSGNNSGVLHCGLYYKPGSLKAKLAVQGIQKMVDFCEENQVPYDICGKAVVATNDKESIALDNLVKRGNQNGLTGLKFLTYSELKAREPFVKATKALLVPQEGIVDYKQVMHILAKKIKENGGEVLTNFSIEKVYETTDEIKVISKEQEFNFDYLFACAGLHSDRIFKLCTGKKSPIKIIPFRGEYLKFKKEYENLVNHLIYPVPDSKYPFLGVHFTRMIDGSKEVGPNAVFTFKREGYEKGSFSVKDSYESLTFKGLQKFIFNNFSFAFDEFKSSVFLTDFVKKAKKMIPDAEKHMFEKGQAGVRAQAVSKKGELIMDFSIEKTKRQIHVLNAPSPGATASLAIAEYVIDKYLI
ncbi:L-2-hydroxyglutarate oxidase [Flavobacteriaceae bacterium]|nr:L-2-hydroxyglutarate oxidase [Flavobacteriaceae bacterium]